MQKRQYEVLVTSPQTTHLKKHLISASLKRGEIYKFLFVCQYLSVRDQSLLAKRINYQIDGLGVLSRKRLRKMNKEGYFVNFMAQHYQTQSK